MRMFGQTQRQRSIAEAKLGSGREPSCGAFCVMRLSRIRRAVLDSTQKESRNESRVSCWSRPNASYFDDSYFDDDDDDDDESRPRLSVG